MKTKIIPFDLEIAKKIQAGEIEGKIKTRDLEKTMNIVCYDSTAMYCDTLQPIIAQATDNCCDIRAYFEDGHFIDSEKNDEDLVLEVPDNEPQFKPFDKVLVRHSDKSEWRPRLYSRKGNVGYCMQDGFGYEQCIPYEGNEHLVGTTDKPKELC